MVDWWESSRRRKSLTGRILGGVIVAGVIGFYFASPSPARFRSRDVYFTQGRVFYEGKPAAGATVTLTPTEVQGDAFRPRGIVGADGTFLLSTYRNEDGAPAGRYRVAISWSETPPVPRGAVAPRPKEEPKVERKKSAKAPPPDPRAAIAKKYEDPQTSGLAAEVRAVSSNQLPPFELR